MATILFIVACLVVVGLLFILYARSVGDENIAQPETLTFPETGWMAAAVLGAICLLFMVLLMVRRWDAKQEAADAAEAFFVPEADRDAQLKAHEAELEAALEGETTFAQGPEVVVYNIPFVPVMYKAWEKPQEKGKIIPYYFPRQVDNAVYTNSYIPIDAKGTQLKLRILLAGPKDADKGPMPPGHEKPKKTEVKAPIKPLEDPFKETGPAASAAPAAPTSPPPSTGGSTRSAPALPRDPGVPSTGRPADGRQFMAELEARIGAPKAPAPEPVSVRTDVHYGYPGDDHPVEDVEGIGVVYGQKLREAGVHTTARLAYEDPQVLADRTGVPRKTVEQWQSMAELLKVSGIGPQYAEALARAGVNGIADLKKRSAAAIADQVNGYLATLETNVLGTTVTAKRIERWQDAASSMRRIRMKVPAQ